jgi:hypothetical protein
MDNSRNDIVVDSLKYYGKMKIISLILFFTLGSCLRNNSKTGKEYTETVEQQNEIEHVEYAEPQKYSLSDIPVNIDEVKRKYEKHTTSSIVNKSEWYKYYRPDTVGFYGDYCLINNDENGESPFVGYLVVFNNSANDAKRWYYYNTSDVFIEITVNTPDLYVYGDICVGSDITHLNRRLGKPNIIINNFHIYSDYVQNVAIFDISERKIRSIRIGRYNENIIKKLGENIYEL